MSSMLTSLIKNMNYLSAHRTVITKNSSFCDKAAQRLKNTARFAAGGGVGVKDQLLIQLGETAFVNIDQLHARR